jgi:hypothetical protein
LAGAEGTAAQMRVKRPGVEESVSAGGRRRTRGTYILEKLAASSTKVSGCRSLFRSASSRR